MATPSIDDEIVLRFVCSELRIPVYALFNLAYAFKYRRLNNRHADVSDFVAYHSIPDYVLEFMYELIEEEQPSETPAEVE